MQRELGASFNARFKGFSLGPIPQKRAGKSARSTHVAS
jgi:hypothetical protein